MKRNMNETVDDFIVTITS